MMTEGQSWGWEGPTGELLKEAIVAGCYRAAIKRNPVRASAFGKLADSHSAKVAALASGIAEADALLQECGLATEPA